MAIFATLDERQRRIAKDMAHAAVAILRENGLELATMTLDNHDHLRLIVEVAASWVLSAESATAAKSVLERRLTRRDHDDAVDGEIEKEEERGLERARTLDSRSGGR